MPVSKGRNKKKSANKSPNNHTRMSHLELKQQQTQGPVQRSQSYYQGVVPSPEMMEKYKNVDPTLPGRLVSLSEEEGAHRRKIESRITNHALTTTLVGQILAFASVLVICVLSYYYMKNGNSSDGRTIAVTIIIGLASLFLGRAIFKKSDKK